MDWASGMDKETRPPTGGSLYTELLGDGPGVVFICSDDQVDLRLWDDQFDAFAERSRTVRYDLRGLGRSPREPVDLSHVDEAVGVIKAADDGPARLIGFGLGATIGLRVALEHPQIVAALVLVSPTLRRWERVSFDDPEFVALMEATQRMFGGPAKASEIVEAFNAGDPEPLIAMVMAQPWYAPAKPEARARVEQMLRDNIDNVESLMYPSSPPLTGPRPLTRLEAIHGPTLVIVGDRDSDDVQRNAIDLEAGIAGALRVVVPDAGH